MTFETRVWSEEPAIQALCKSPADEEAQAITVEMELEQISEAR